MASTTPMAHSALRSDWLSSSRGMSSVRPGSETWSPRSQRRNESKESPGLTKFFTTPDDDAGNRHRWNQIYGRRVRRRPDDPARKPHDETGGRPRLDAPGTRTAAA